MQKTDVINIVAARTELKREDIALILDTAIDIIIDSVIEGRKVSFKNFGYFEAREHAAHRAYNPITHERFTVPARRNPVFRPSDIFKERVREYSR